MVRNYTCLTWSPSLYFTLYFNLFSWWQSVCSYCVWNTRNHQRLTETEEKEIYGQIILILSWRNHILKSRRRLVNKGYNWWVSIHSIEYRCAVTRLLLVKGIWLCLWELWHSDINKRCVVLIMQCYNSYKHSQSIDLSSYRKDPMMQ